MDVHAACRDCRPGYLMQTDANISYTGISDVHERLSVTIKVRFVVALRAAYLVHFCHEDSSPFGSTCVLW